MEASFQFGARYRTVPLIFIVLILLPWILYHLYFEPVMKFDLKSKLTSNRINRLKNIFLRNKKLHNHGSTFEVHGFFPSQYFLTKPYFEMKIGSLIRELRKRRNLTQEELGSRIGVSKAYVSKIESGAQVPRLEQIKKFSDALEVGEHFLLMQTVNIGDFEKDGDKLREKIALKYKELYDLFDKMYFDEKEKPVLNRHS